MLEFRVPDKKSLIVSLHDAHPGSRAQIAEQVAFLATYGVTRSSILVVPEFHHGATAAGDPAFREAVTAWQASGNEIVLHGYFHDRKESPRETLSTLFWTRLYTSQEAEFLDLPRETAQDRLARGRKLFESLGWRANGFVAPAWLMGEWIPGVLAEMNFAYTTTLKEIVPLAPGTNRVAASQSLCYSTRSWWRPMASAYWNKHLFHRLRETDLIRLSLHPRDLEFPLLRRQIDQIVRSALKRGFEPTTYGEYVAR
ncbi:MAG TPA: polysaccharide deacetylase family protein [Candidatus Methylacidiphilales bacterium]|nr:polysaccharide deacetylase family protein [Candidatus Methylacidiphilales bacterium]